LIPRCRSGSPAMAAPEYLIATWSSSRIDHLQGIHNPSAARRVALPSNVNFPGHGRPKTYCASRSADGRRALVNRMASRRLRMVRTAARHMQSSYSGLQRFARGIPAAGGFMTKILPLGPVRARCQNESPRRRRAGGMVCWPRGYGERQPPSQ